MTATAWTGLVHPPPATIAAAASTASRDWDASRLLPLLALWLLLLSLLLLGLLLLGCSRLREAAARGSSGCTEGVIDNRGRDPSGFRRLRESGLSACRGYHGFGFLFDGCSWEVVSIRVTLTREAWGMGAYLKESDQPGPQSVGVYQRELVGLPLLAWQALAQERELQERVPEASHL